MSISPLIRKIAAGSFLGIALLAVTYQTVVYFRQGDHEHAEDDQVLLYDLREKRLASYPVQTLPGSQNTCSLMLFVRAKDPTKPKVGMTLADLEKGGLTIGWLYRMSDDHQVGLYAAPTEPDVWIRSDSPECHNQLDQWVDQAARASATGRATPYKK